MFVLLLPNQANSNLARLCSYHLTMEDITQIARERDLLWVRARHYCERTDRGKVGELVPLGRYLALIDGEWILIPRSREMEWR